MGSRTIHEPQRMLVVAARPQKWPASLEGGRNLAIGPSRDPRRVERLDYFSSGNKNPRPPDDWCHLFAAIGNSVLARVP